MDVPEILKIPLESFDRNARVNRVTLATITPADLRFGDSAGGFNIGQHLADIINFRPDWLSRIAPHHVASLPSVVADDSPTWLSTDDIGELQAAIDDGDAAIRAAVLEAVGEGRSFERVYQTHPAHFIQHCIVHDSHHRGQILALLRQSGRPTEERERLESESWPIWRE